MTEKRQTGITKIEILPEETGAMRGEAAASHRPRRRNAFAGSGAQANGQNASLTETGEQEKAPQKKKTQRTGTGTRRTTQKAASGNAQNVQNAEQQKPAQRQNGQRQTTRKKTAQKQTDKKQTVSGQTAKKQTAQNPTTQNPTGRRQTVKNRTEEGRGAQQRTTAKRQTQSKQASQQTAPKRTAAAKHTVAKAVKETAEKAAATRAEGTEAAKSAAELLREQREARLRKSGARISKAASPAVEFSPETNTTDLYPQSAAVSAGAGDVQGSGEAEAGTQSGGFIRRLMSATNPAKRTGRRKAGAVRKTEHVRIIPLGGLEQIGMNITAFEYRDSIVVVDCGMAFPDDEMLGIDLVVPDISYLKKNADKVKGFFITHGHEDHIGALPYVLRELNVPVYSTRLTIALIENKLREAQLLESAKLNIVKHGDVVPAGDFRMEFIKTNHSIQDASAIAIHSPAGVLLHTGDFKVDYTPVFGDAIDLQRFAELGKQGVLALMADSTNALRPGFTMSERTVGHTFDTIFAEHPKNRIIIATFASNVDRVQQVINDAEKYDRKVVVEGRSMVNVIGTAAELGYIKIKDGTLIDIAQLKDYPPEKTVLVTTGSQGESMAALSRMASGQHRKISIGPDDVIVLSSTPIPGNEKAVARVINELSQKHAEIINQDTHVSGHACQEELKLIYSLVHPKFAIPVHGEYRHRMGQKKIAESVGIPKENIVIAETGDVIDLSEEGCKVVDHVQAGPLMVDGLGVGDVGNIVLRDRQNLAQNGIIIVVLALEKRSNRVVGGPDIVSRGFVYVRENEDLMEDARIAVMDSVDDCQSKGVSDWSRIKNEVREALSDFFWKRMKRTPVILPIITEVV